MNAWIAPTPEGVAEAIAGDLSSFDEGNDWEIDHERTGNAITVTVTPQDADTGARLDEQQARFQAVVVEVPAYAVAAQPVTLPAGLARELAYGYAGDDVEGWTVVANDYTGRTRWSSTHHLVIRNEAGEHFADTYRRGLSESQERRPYEDESTATFTPVVPNVKVVTEWESTKSGGAA